MSRKVMHERLKNTVVLTSAGKIKIDQDGKVDISGFKDTQINKLLSIPYFYEDGKKKAVEKDEDKKEVNNEKEAENDYLSPDKKVNLYTMKLADLKEYAEKKGIELKAVKRNDIINEIKEYESK